MNEKNLNEVIRFETMRIRSIVAANDHDTAINIINTNYRIYINALKALKLTNKSSSVRPNWIVTIKLYRKLLKDYGLPYGACTV